MPRRPDRDCLGCHKATDPTTLLKGRCPTCAGAKQEHTNATRSDDARYQTAAWHRFSLWLRGLNPICQHIDEHGKQCTQWSRMVHHIKSVAEYPHLMYVAENCVCLCFRHHSPELTTGKFAPTEIRHMVLPGHDKVVTH
jgi:hypothetical protein